MLAGVRVHSDVPDSDPDDLLLLESDLLPFVSLLGSEDFLSAASRFL